MKHHIIISSFLLFASLNVWAQGTVKSEEHQLVTVTNPWLSTENGAGLGVSSYRNHSKASLGFESFGGDYHRAQEGNRINKLDFFAETYNQISKNWLAWGSFRFNMGTEKGRAWSDVIDTYNSSPYIFGSSIKASYDTQMFDLHFKLSRPTKGKMTYGAAVDYKVADVSRLRDPRSRTQFADYALKPSALFSFNKNNQVGLTGIYRWKKEKLPNVTTVQDDPNILYYSMLGMEFASAMPAGYKGFKRRFVSTYWGGNMQYAHHNSKNQLLLSAGVMLEDMKVEEDIKYSPGTFGAYHVNASAYFNHQFNRTLLSAKLNSCYKHGSANENLQELISTIDPSTGINSKQWNTLYTYNDRFRVVQYSTDLDVNLRQHKEKSNDYGWLVGLKSSINGFQQAYSMPTSTNDVKLAKVGAYTSLRLFNKNDRNLRVSFHANYNFKLTNDLKLAETSKVSPSISASSYQLGTYNYATNVLEVDKMYFDANNCNYGVEAQYNFPLQIKKTELNPFIKAYFSGLHSKNFGNWNGAGVSVGVIL